MRKIIASIIAAICAIGMNVPVMALEPGGVLGATERTNILNECGEKTGADSITCVLKLVVTILGIGVGILGVIGISVSGVQYLTAGGSEEKARKAKRRIYEIVIGLALYAVLYFALQWLLPGF